MNLNTVISKNPEALPMRSLKATDRCDLCGAQALVRVRLVSGTLDWCKHHFERYEPNLDAAAIEIDDRPALDAEEGRA